MNMRFLTKPVLTIAVLVSVGLPNAGAFSMMGPPAAWQIPALQYQVGGDIGSPQNLGEEYRVNLPTVFYAMDQTFLDYFGLRGAQAVDEAFGVFNALPPVSHLSESLEEYPLEASRLNYRAASLQLMDVKTTLMTAIAESLALDDPIRWNWCVRAIRSEEHTSELQSPC